MWSVSKATTQTQFQKLHQKALTMSELFLKKYTWPSLKAKLKTSNGTSIEISKIRFGEKLAKLKIKHLYSIRNKKEKQRVNFLIHKDLKKKKNNVVRFKATSNHISNVTIWLWNWYKLSIIDTYILTWQSTKKELEKFYNSPFQDINDHFNIIREEFKV